MQPSMAAENIAVYSDLIPQVLCFPWRLSNVQDGLCLFCHFPLPSQAIGEASPLHPCWVVEDLAFMFPLLTGEYWQGSAIHLHCCVSWLALSPTRWDPLYEYFHLPDLVPLSRWPHTDSARVTVRHSLLILFRYLFMLCSWVLFSLIILHFRLKNCIFTNLQHCPLHFLEDFGIRLTVKLLPEVFILCSCFRQ